MFEDCTRLWVIHIGNSDRIAKRAQVEGFVCIGWTVIGDLTVLDTREKMKAAYRKAFPKKSDASIRSSYGQVFRFAHEIGVGDPIVYPIKGSRDILIGRVAGPYEWASRDKQLVEADYCNIRRVEWLKTAPRIAFTQEALHSFGGFSSVATSDDYLEEVIAVLKGDRAAVLPQEKVVARDKLAEDDEPERSASLAERATEETEDFLLRQWSRSKQEFEAVVAAVFRAMNYTAKLQAGTHDLGVDVVAHPDPLGVQPPLLKIQAKSGTSSAGSKDLKALRGLLNAGEKGVLVSLGGFSTDAKHVQQNDANLVLIDGERFVELFLEFYDRLDAETRHKFPLRRVYVYVG